jgi:class 3 adenylate cyclase
MSEDRTWLATTLFLDIVGYTKLSVDQQVEVKKHFLSRVSTHTQDLDEADSIRLDTGDGLAYCYLGDPVAMYPVAHGMRDDFAQGADFAIDYQVRMGINIGPVRLVDGASGERNCLGAGINEAQRVMDFAAANQLLASKSYFEVVSKVSNYCAENFSSLGGKFDKHNQEHQVYELTDSPLNRSSMNDIGVKSIAKNALEIEERVEEHLLKELSSCVGRARATEVFESARHEAENLKSLCAILSAAIERQDDRDSFNSFTKSYGYSGY